MKYSFGVDFQQKLLKILIEENNIQLLDYLEEDLFDGTEAKLVYTFIANKVKKDLKVPSYDHLATICGGVFLKEDEHTAIKNQVLEYLEQTKKLEIDKTEVIELVSQFIKAQTSRKLTLQMASDFEDGVYDTDKYEEELIKVNSLTLTRDDQILYTKDREKLIVPRERIPTGFPRLTKWYDGGLAKGELGLVLGETDIGKSFMLVNFAKPCMNLSKDVVYVTFELSKEDVKFRFDKLFKRCYGKGKKFTSEIVIKEYPPSTITVQTLRGYIGHLRSVEKLNPEMILIDSLKHMNPLYHTNDDWRNLHNVAMNLRAVAKQEDVAIWSIAHVKATAFGKDFTKKDVARSIELMNETDISIGLILTDVEDELDIKQMKRRRVKSRKGKIRIKLELDDAYMYEKVSHQ